MTGSAATNSMLASIDEARAWLYEAALPFWSRTGLDDGWGFVDHLSRDALPAERGDKRLRVQARQVYVFCHASLLGYQGGIDAARCGWTFMRDYGWSEHGGWVRRLGTRGRVVDPTLDMYDQAFALLAIAWWIKASGEDALSWADQTLEVIDERLASPWRVGWLSETGPRAALLQNPHMHLLEALLALYDASGEDRYKSFIERVLAMFTSVLFDATTGTIAEYYENRWRRAAGERGRIVEPGHHYEWVWLLYQAEHVVPGSIGPVDAIFKFAEDFGYDPTTGLVYDEVLEDGPVRTATHRLWPNAEALKAHLARFEFGGILDVTRTSQILDNLLGRYLATATPGTWIDQLDAEGQPQVDKIPASSLYHLFLALSELLRLESRLRAAVAST